ncbi:tRNA:m4X modification enzyme, partial [Linderina macrospora]
MSEADMPAASFADLLKAVHISAEFNVDVASHPAVDQPKSWKQNPKYARQQSSLVGHMDRRGMLNPEFCFIEFGAGKGELSVYVHSVLETRRKTGNTIVLVDRQNARRKFQIIQDKQDSGDECATHDQFHRILIDIRDLDLAQVKELQIVDKATGQACLRPIVAYSKHLCGAATDLTIKCLENYQRAGGRVAGMAIALCCHQVCKYSMMLDHDYLSQAIPRTQPVSDAMWDDGQRKSFYCLTAMSSWAINAPAQGSEAKHDQDIRIR